MFLYIYNEACTHVFKTKMNMFNSMFCVSTIVLAVIVYVLHS